MVPITAEKAIVATFSAQADAMIAVRRLQIEGVASERLSLVGSKWEAKESLQGHWNLPDWEKAGLESEGKREGFWVGSLFGMLEGFAFFLVPGLGPLVALGPVVGFLVGGSLGTVVGFAFGEATAEEISTRYREKLAMGNFLVIITCMAEDEAGFRKKVDLVHPSQVEVLPVKSVVKTSHNGPRVI